MFSVRAKFLVVFAASPASDRAISTLRLEQVPDAINGFVELRIGAGHQIANSVG